MLSEYSSLLSFLGASLTSVLCVTDGQRGCAPATPWMSQTWGLFTVQLSPLVTADLPAATVPLACLLPSPKVCFSPSLLITKTQLDAAECKPAAKHEMKGKSARRWGKRLRKLTLDLGHVFITFPGVTPPASLGRCHTQSTYVPALPPPLLGLGLHPLAPVLRPLRKTCSKCISWWNSKEIPAF